MFTVAGGARAPKSKFYNAMRRYGVENFSIELVRSDAKNFAELQRQEIEEISARGTVESGYNVSPGGSIGTPDQTVIGDRIFASKSAAATVKYRGETICAFGEQFKSLDACAVRFGIKPATLRRRVRQAGQGIEQAIREL